MNPLNVTNIYVVSLSFHYSLMLTLFKNTKLDVFLSDGKLGSCTLIYLNVSLS